MVDPAPALAAALIWAYAPVVYKDFVEKLGVVKLNLLRMAYAAAALLAPALASGINEAALLGALSGVLSLALGDSFYLRSIKATGVSVAAPASYSYIIIEQFAAVALGEPLRANYLAAAALMVAGVYLLASGGGRASISGVAFALGAALSWAAGYAAVKAAGVEGLSPVATAFIRTAAALAVLAVAGRGEGIGTAFRSTWRSPLPLIAALDLGVGSALFAYSSVTAGLGLTVIMTGITPLAAQLISRAAGKERPAGKEYAAAVLALAAVAISFI